MSAAKTHSAEILGLEGEIIDVEVDLAPGLFHFSIVGLPDKAVEESRERVSSAIKNTGLRHPQKKNQRVVVSLAPADLKKEGPLFDLAIAVGYLMASKQIEFDSSKKLFLGELALDGSLRRNKGARNRETRIGLSRGRRASRADGWTPRNWKDNARSRAPLHSSSNEFRRSFGSDKNPFRLRKFKKIIRIGTPIQKSSPHCLIRRARRRWAGPKAWRNHACAPRSFVPR